MVQLLPHGCLTNPFFQGVLRSVLRRRVRALKTALLLRNNPDVSHGRRPPAVMAAVHSGIFDSEPWLSFVWLRGAGSELCSCSGASLSVPKCGHYLETFLTAGEPLTAA